MIQELLHILSPYIRATEFRQSDPQWESLLQLAEDHQLLLPFWEQLNNSSLSPPPSVLEHWEPLITQRVLEQLRRSQQLVALLELLGSGNIKVLAYKGPTLGLLAFGSAAGRESCDLDLLVSPDDYEHAVAVLTEDGFEYERTTVPRCYLKLSYEVSLVHAERGIVVDLHRSFFGQTQSFPLTLENCQAFSVKISGSEIPTLTPEDLFFVLCVHGSKHAWRELRWVYDLVALVSRQSLNWQEVYRKARAANLLRPVRIGLELCRQLFGLPPNALFFPDARSSELTSRSVGYIFGSRPNLQELQSYHWAYKEIMAQRLKYLWFLLVFPHELDLEWFDLPPSLWPFYYALRPARIALGVCQKALSGPSKSERDE